MKNIIPSFVNTSIDPLYQNGIAEQESISLLRHPLKPVSYMWYLQWLETLYSGPDFYHIQIGAFTADDTEDPFSTFIRTGSWSSVFVEPQPHVFQRIQTQNINYTNVIPVNAAVCSHDQSRCYILYAT